MKHRPVTKCLREDAPISRYCSCSHCTLLVCEVCGAWEGSLTTHCPGEKVGVDKQDEVYTTPLDFTVERGWHQGNPMGRRNPEFES